MVCLQKNFLGAQHIFIFALIINAQIITVKFFRVYNSIYFIYLLQDHEGLFIQYFNPAKILLKNRFRAVEETHNENLSYTYDNRGKPISVLYATEKILRQRNIINRKTTRYETNQHHSFSNIDRISRITFPIFYIVFLVCFFLACNSLEDVDKEGAKGLHVL